MSLVPRFSDFKTWVGKPLGKSQWDFNLNKIIEYLTAGTYSLFVNSINATTASVSGTVTAGAYFGDGSNLSGIATNNTDNYGFYAKYFSTNEWDIGQQIVTKAATISSIDAFLEMGAGTILTSCSSTSGFATSSADTTALSVDAYDQISGGSINITKSGTSTNSAGAKYSAAMNLAASGEAVEFYLKLATTTNVTSVRLTAATDGSNYRQWAYTSDIASSLLTTKWQTFRQYIASSGTDVGSYVAATTTYVTVDITTANNSDTFNGTKLGGITNITGTAPLNINLYKNNELIKQSGDTYTFSNLLAGTTSIKNVALENAIIASSDILRLSVIGTATSAVFAGQNLTVLARTV